MEERIGQYTIVEELGRGGMGIVYKAKDPSLDRFVAIKVLSTQLTEDPNYVQRFDREARAAAALNHPNIVQIYTTGEDAGRHYFVMEYVKGTSVQELIRKEGRLEPARAAGIVLQAASGLAAAHAAGILHRDIKPGNLMLDERGIVKIADFGLALAPEAATRLTATGMLMGTPGYLSPEQCMDKPADARSDIYSLGATFFEMLVGRTPFTADSPLALLRKIVEVEPPDVGELNPAVDPELWRVVARMIAKDPAQRYQACDGIVDDLRRWMEVSGAGSVIPAASASRAAAAASGAAGNLGDESPTVLVAGGSGQAAAPPSPAAPVPPAATPPKPERPTPPAPTPPTAPSGAHKRTVAVAAAIILLLLLGLATAGVVAWKFGAGPLAALMGTGSAQQPASSTASSVTTRTVAETTDAATAPRGFGDVSGVEVQHETTARTRGGQAPAAGGPAAASSRGHGVAPGQHATASAQASGGALAPSQGSASPSHAALAAQPPATAPGGTIVLAVGEKLAAGEAGRYLRERLARAGIDLREIDDFPRALDLVERNPDPSTNAILSRLHGRAAKLVLVRATYLGSRELNYIGHGSTVTETGSVRMTGGGLQGQRTFTGANPDQAHRSRLTVTCYDLATTHTLAPRWSTTVEYTELNAGRNVEKALGDEAGTIIDLLRR